MVLDPCLALVTLLIWLSEERGPLLHTFYEELLAPIRACGLLKTGGSILIILFCFIIGLIQLIFWCIFVVRPDFAQTLFKLEQFEGFASGYLCAFFYLISIHAWFISCALCSQSKQLSPTWMYFLSCVTRSASFSYFVFPWTNWTKPLPRTSMHWCPSCHYSPIVAGQRRISKGKQQSQRSGNNQSELLSCTTLLGNRKPISTVHWDEWDRLAENFFIICKREITMNSIY